MSQSLSKVYVHLTFSTKGRYPFIDQNIQERLWQYLGGICKGLECNPIQIGGYKDHVHILCLLSKKITQMKLVEEVKKQSSKWIKTIDDNYAKFYWQDGYGIFSVNPSEIEIVVQYIKNQEEHHKKRTFKEELVAFLNKYNVTYDERFLWD
ncbi:IS200/IS605 family transposase [Flavobacterium chilense]|uniref:REP element-mobilizing transposase RayT n=1 Tax=Flavobacterium chilense TaxID=946677 RepID=A0A1M7JEZ0_9FLAO|nr:MULTISPECIES: IS200/IS605 family transposase [Flavobacterium]SHM51403.1 REP element-mobilizing transposase RayT [Flavobacterium chilense]